MVNSEAGALVVALTASDPDLGLNLQPPGEEAASFTIDPASGEVRTRWGLDREEQEQATLTITDNAGPGDFFYKSSAPGPTWAGSVGEIFSLDVKVFDSRVPPLSDGGGQH